MEPISFKVKNPEAASDGSVDFSLQLVGSLPVHSLTTMPVLPWIVAEIRRMSSHSLKEEESTSQIRLYVSPTRLRCEADTGKSQQWDPLICSSIFECRPQHVHKLIHNSHDPSYFACLIKDGAINQQSICYVFKADDQTKVPEIISTIRQAGKIARQEDFQNNLSDVEDPFSKKFEVLFCGRVTVAHKNAPPALIDECIEKFNDVSDTKKLDSDSFSQQHETTNHSGGFSISGKFRSVFQPLVNEEQEKRPMRKSYSQPGLRSLAFKKDLQAASSRSHSFVRSFDDDVALNLKSQFIQGQNVQPTDIAGNRIMLFTIGQSEVYIISPDTKKVVIEKSFKEISFCSQGIRHVDHFGFICRESSENRGFHFVCYVFQCTDEALVDEIMMTLKQAFTVAAIQQNPKAQLQFCDKCPMQSLHKLCEKIEGMHPSKTKLELQKHLTTLNNEEQVSVFEEVQKIRPRNEQKENELIISVLRSLYEEKQKDHTHLGESKQTTQSSVEAVGSEMPSNTPRFRLDMLKNKAKRSLTESLESILSRGNKSKNQLESSESIDLDSSLSSTVSTTSKEASVCEVEDLLPTESPPKANGSVNNVPIESESACTEQPAKAAYQGFRRRANTLTHVPTENQDCSEPTEASPPVPQRKLMRYHSVGTETPHHQTSSNASADQSMPARPLSPPPAHLKPSASSPNFLKHLRSNSSGEQTRRAVPKSTSYRSTLRKKLHSSSSVPNFLKFLAPVDENNTSDFRNTKSDYKPMSSEADSFHESPVRTRRHSWRQQIFLRVATPQKGCDSTSWHDDYSELGELPPRSPLQPLCEDGPFRTIKEERKRSPKELRELWQKAILQQILLLRMEKENQKLQASENNLLNKRLKLDYEEITPCLKEVTLIWEKMLGTPGRSKMKFDTEKIHSAVGKGIPKHHRGEIWKFLAEQHQLNHQFTNRQQPKDTPYKELLKQLTSQQHAILIDLGRTFPTHPYFSAQLGAGQLSLYNILKAYSLLDQEVGYCQGLSFVAGVLLLHMSEEEAFKMLKFLMFDMGLRKQYRPDMTILQIQMYQLSRLLHDYHRDLYNHFEAHEIGPSLYAAPWFLTMFASQFPLGFVARVFDILFLHGPEVIFKVALSLLGSHKPLILQHENLETIVDFIKCILPNLGLVQMEKTINQVFEMDISKQLQAYEVEYYVLQDELIDSSLSDNQRIDKLEKGNNSLRQQNIRLLEELQVANAKIQNLEGIIETLLNNESKQKQTILTLELERKTLLETVAELRMGSPVPSRKSLLTRQEHLDASN
uniref:TBC1 domain family member 4 n=2 Tax=Anolis carolinensis TaxID=28377 RepID=H9GCJ1_ANOCA|nr:PREDICTED: TBC1 domain family member 1 isoform X1 [Anolis carolinensis]XP_008117210.1 PREDICTED: TBC1 domain family member 1 isoform X1 [Anolis carolinensis]XP_008117211.1 PREDICTED: TBC1 domain family member 1 isoform X1 [Anolis carolinensis]XP_016852234.1 PREDICTED: TBC1 domain family member 1 isoform X1 [Anolis carolinensis]|eukprot:XP_008117209.1 PREDICTED: TBC1 domain family member 1 isoform X1 [Anolis carolinensis]